MAGHSDTFHHVRDFPYLELPFGIELPLPEVFGLQLTKFMLLQVVAGCLTLFIFSGLARRAKSGKPVKGLFWNFWEVIALYIRDEVVRPTIGDDHHDHDHEHGHNEDGKGDHGGSVPHVPAVAHASGAIAVDASHPADRYLPFIWSCFFYVLFCNLLGAIPFMGSATGEINVTGALAVACFVATTLYSVNAIGIGGFFKNFMGGVEINGVVDLFVVALLFPIEVIGYLIKHAVLAVRLFANIMGGHTVLGVMLGFISAAASSYLFILVAPASVLGQVAVGLLELMVAFIQAYVFAFLATIFIAMAVHEH